MSTTRTRTRASDFWVGTLTWTPPSVRGALRWGSKARKVLYSQSELGTQAHLQPPPGAGSREQLGVLDPARTEQGHPEGRRSKHQFHEAIPLLKNLPWLPITELHQAHLPSITLKQLRVCLLTLASGSFQRSRLTLPTWPRPDPHRQHLLPCSISFSYFFNIFY